MAKYRLAQQANSEEAMAVVAEEVEKDLGSKAEVTLTLRIIMHHRDF